MNFVQALSEFFAYQFPWWGVCHLKFEPSTRIVYFHCLTPSKRAMILRDAIKIAYLDIGIEKFVIMQPGYPSITIPHVSKAGK